MWSTRAGQVWTHSTSLMIIIEKLEITIVMFQKLHYSWTEHYKHRELLELISRCVANFKNGSHIRAYWPLGFIFHNQLVLSVQNTQFNLTVVLLSAKVNFTLMVTPVGVKKNLLEKVSLLQSRCYCRVFFFAVSSQLLTVQISHPGNVVPAELFPGQIHEIKDNVNHSSNQFQRNPLSF